MLTDIKKKELSLVQEMCDSYRKACEQTKAELDAIDEKYRKIIEDEKKSLKEQLSEIKAQQKVWEKMLNNLIPNEAEAAPVEKKEDEPEVVVDTLFPENNEELPAEEEIPAEEPVKEDTAVALEDFPFASEEKHTEKVAEAVEEEDPFGDTNDDPFEDMVFPEQPEEWNNGI